MNVTVLYTPEVLALAVRLAEFPIDPTYISTVKARSSTCGSELEMGIELDSRGIIVRIGISARACAIGQASAAIFALSARGKHTSDVMHTGQEVRLWLANEGPIPDWPGLHDIAAAQNYVARHGAVMLPWLAAERLLGETETTG